MKVNIPFAGSFLLITRKVPAPESIHRWGTHSLVGRLKKPAEGQMYHRQAIPISLEEGEWYRVRNIRGSGDYLLVDLALESKSKDRAWVRAKIPPEYRLTRHWFRILARDLNLIAECYTDIESLKNRIGLIHAGKKKLAQDRFSKIANEGT